MIRDHIAAGKKEHSKYEPKSELKYCIDNMLIENGEITITGWAFVNILLPTGECESLPAEFRIEDVCGNNLESSVKRKFRKDVNEIFLNHTVQIDVGFELKWVGLAENNEIYRIIISGESSTEIVVVDCAQLETENRERQRHYAGIWDMWCNRDEKLLSDDWEYLWKNGPAKYGQRVKKRFEGIDKIYNYWRRKYIPSKKDMRQQKKKCFPYEPKISIIVPTYKTPENFLREMIDSVQKQTYANWELCIGDGSVEDGTVESIVKDYQKKDNRIKLVCLTENLGISGNTNAALKLAEGEYIALLDHDDLLTPNALYEIVDWMNQHRGKNTDIIYSDEDKVSVDLKCYFEPHFKSDYNLDLLRSNNYICHFFVVAKKIVDEVGGFRKEYDGSQDYDFILRCIEKSEKVEHIPQVLYHWRSHSGSTAANRESKHYCYEAARSAISDHLFRVGEDNCQVKMCEHLGFYHVVYPVKHEELVSIIIPNKDQKEVLERCITSILQKTKYENYEIIIIENNSTSDEIFAYYNEIENEKCIKVVRWENEFNYSAINNWGVSQAKGEYILFLNNDIEVINPGWLTELLGNIQRKEVGAVGARLLYPDETVQHAGVIIGMGRVAGHAFSRHPKEDPGYFARSIIQQNLNIVTAACLLTRREIFYAVQGFEEKLAVAFNDVDFCLKIRNAGYLVVYDPEVLLYHHESVSRGAENTPEKMARFETEAMYMEEKWKSTLEKGDEYYNPNLSLKSGNYELK